MWVQTLQDPTKPQMDFVRTDKSLIKMMGFSQINPVRIDKSPIKMDFSLINLVRIGKGHASPSKKQPPRKEPSKKQPSKKQPSKKQPSKKQPSKKQRSKKQPSNTRKIIFKRLITA